MWTLVPRVWKTHKKNSATLIQRYVRGFLVFRHMLLDVRMRKFDLNYGHFSEIRL